MITSFFETEEQLLRAQQMVLEAYIDNLSGDITYSTDEVKAIIYKIIHIKE